MKSTRRDLLQFSVRSVAAAGLATALPGIMRGASSGNRTAVCIFLVGGNDSNNMIVPTADSEYRLYEQARGMLSVPRQMLLPVSSARQKTSFGFHPSMPEVQRLYEWGALGVLANEGALAQHTRKLDVVARRSRLPENLFAHTGGDKLKYAPYGTAFPPWAVLGQRRPEQDSAQKGPQVFKIEALSAMSLDRPKIEGAERENATLVNAIASVRVNTPFPDTSIGTQLLTALKLAKAGPSAGLTRPVFTAMMSGYDTHRDQNSRQPVLFAELSQALGAFYDGLRELGIERDVTAFTHTEFNRTLSPNENGGTEHAWGGHQLILGGAVMGGDVYGEFPDLALSGEHNIGSGGIFVPTTSGHEYLAEIARWHGSPAGDGPVPAPGRAPLSFLS